MLKRGLIIGLAAAWLLAPHAAPGAVWVIEEVDADFPADRVVYYYGDEWVRVEGYVSGLVFLVRLPAEEGFIVDEERGYYAGGRLTEVAKAMEEPRRKEEAGEGENREESLPAAGIPGLRTEEASGGEEVAGFPARHYRVYLGDLLVEELWVAPGIAVGSADAPVSLRDALDVMTGEGPGQDFAPAYEEQPAYRAVLEQGYVVRRVTYYRNTESRVEVVKAERKDLPGPIFQRPEGAEEAPYRELFLGKK